MCCIWLVRDTLRCLTSSSRPSWKLRQRFVDEQKPLGDPARCQWRGVSHSASRPCPSTWPMIPSSPILRLAAHPLQLGTQLPQWKGREPTSNVLENDRHLHDENKYNIASKMGIRYSVFGTSPSLSQTTKPTQQTRRSPLASGRLQTERYPMYVTIRLLKGHPW